MINYCKTCGRFKPDCACSSNSSKSEKDKNNEKEQVENVIDNLSETVEALQTPDENDSFLFEQKLDMLAARVKGIEDEINDLKYRQRMLENGWKPVSHEPCADCFHSSNGEKPLGMIWEKDDGVRKVRECHRPDCDGVHTIDETM